MGCFTLGYLALILLIFLSIIFQELKLIVVLLILLVELPYLYLQVRPLLLVLRHLLALHPVWLLYSL